MQLIDEAAEPSDDEPDGATSLEGGLQRATAKAVHAAKYGPDWSPYLEMVRYRSVNLDELADF